MCQTLDAEVYLAGPVVIGGGGFQAAVPGVWAPPSEGSSPTGTRSQSLPNCSWWPSIMISIVLWMCIYHSLSRWYLTGSENPSLPASLWFHLSLRSVTLSRGANCALPETDQTSSSSFAAPKSPIYMITMILLPSTILDRYTQCLLVFLELLYGLVRDQVPERRSL